jgi:hypothetical protein
VGGAFYQHVHFKPIGDVIVDLGAKNTPDGEKEVEVSWDLGDLTENNGGLWPAPIAHWDHFCVRVAIWQPGDATPHATVQHNFFNIISTSPFAPVPVVIANSDREPRKFKIMVRRLPEKWSLVVKGLVLGHRRVPVINSKQRELNFELKPGEERYLTMTIVPGDESESEPKPIEIQLFMDERSIGGMSFMANRKGPNAPIYQRRISYLPKYVIRPSPSIRFHKE